jgi:hypothetical protein
MATDKVTHINKAHLFGVPATFVAYQSNAHGSTVVGWVMPNLQAADITHHASEEMIRSKSGAITSGIVSGEYLECTFQLIPESDSVANAAKSAAIFSAGTTFVISGMPTIAAGPFPDAFNVDSGGTAPATSRWIYFSGGSSKHSNTGIVTQSITLRRFVELDGLTDAVIV